MKKVKKLMALLLSVIMVLAMSVTAFAEESKTPATAGNLTVNVQSGSLKGQKIYLFKLFNQTFSNPAEYTVNNTYKEALKEVLNVSTDVDYDLYSAIAALGEDGSTPVQQFADNFTKKIIAGGTITGSVDAGDYKIAEVATDVTSHTFENVAPGYYLVYLGGAVKIQSSLINVDGDKSVNLKTTTPTPDKEASSSTVQVGDVLTYTVTAKVPDISAYNPEKYVFKLHDTLSAGLDFVADAQGTTVSDTMTVNVTVNGVAVEPALTATIAGRTMTLDLADVVKNNQETNIGTDIVVTYYAQVNEDAVIDNTSNSAKLEYSNDPSTGGTGESIPDIVKTPTFAINVHKYEQGKETEYLAGAKFQLHKDTAEGTVIKMAAENNNGKYVVAKDQTKATVETVVTVNSKVGDGNYNLQINGLAAGTYYLTETEAPADFNKVKEPIKIVVTDTTKDGTPSYTITVNDAEQPATDNIVTVANVRGTILPGTGGMGTVIFTAVGIVLILGVGVSFVISRKRNAA